MAATSNFYPGKRLSFTGHLCTVRYVGEIKGTEGEWLGVEWDDPTRGKHSGEHGGTRYFQCRHKSPTAASFVRPNRASDAPRTFVEALRYKYDSESSQRFPTPISYESGRRSGNLPAASVWYQDRAIRISGKEVEEVGFEKIRRRLAELQELRIVLLDGLCITRQLSAFRGRAGVEAELASGTDVKDVSPKIIELDLSRNLFEEWREIAQICVQLENQRSLRVDESRFRDVDLTPEEQKRYATAFQNIHTLTLSDTLLSWSEMTRILSLFTSLTTLTASHNAFAQLDIDLLPEKLTELTLENNDFHAISDVRPLAKLRHLKRLVLKNNVISAISDASQGTSHCVDQSLIFSPSLGEVDFSHNSISTWSFIDALAATFPSLTSLRIANNPLYHDLRSPDTKPLSAEDGYMLTIARLAPLRTLNFSPIAPKERLNAETYYLSLIARELSQHPEHLVPAILAQHPRYRALCDEYGEPAVQRTSGDANPNALAARLLTLKCRLGDEAAEKVAEGVPMAFEVEMPRSFSVYNALGVVGKRIGLPPMGLKLFWETGEWDPVGVAEGGGDVEDWDSEGDDVGEARAVGVQREVELVAGTRLVGTWIDSQVANVRVELMEDGKN